ncbi:ubiquitin-like domain-containing protein [Barrientosiimonas marina]|uniref:Ubiquitin-like domain-containing protein n=1 Tax=Lentibacillus kimchii TaxID=1542911 RepID=A0ABW2US12_9BACI
MKVFSKLLPSKTRHWILSGAGLLALMIFCGFMIAETTKAEVTVADNGDEQTVKTNADTVQDLLDEEGITYSKHDDLSHTIDAPVEDGMTIKYDEANKLTVAINNDKDTYYTTADTINEFLDNHDLTVGKYDEASEPAAAAITDGMDYSIDKAFDVTVEDAGEKRNIHPTTQQSVEELLTDNDIEVDDLDQVSPSLDATIEKGDDIKITRVEKSKETVDESIAYDTEKRDDDSLEKGKTKIVSEGQEGTVAKTYEVTTENGEAVDRQLMNKEVKQKSENKIVAHGTKEKDTNVTKLSAESSSNNQEAASSSKKELQMNATAYTVDCLGCDGKGLTATGINLHENPHVVSVDPNVIPLGSRVWVEGYGNAVAGDTGGNIQGNRIDLHFTSQSKASSFGRQTVTVKVLD